ncbi:aldolase/citrate lyase family protein [Gammaproteobacteria bacterium]|nr:aldolase/citrate lyase family protein [Gammaproteobacteria bacterium]MDB4242846.1 aldolase/citrate lyase family protein [Gammaproteobacteria bacterium]
MNRITAINKIRSVLQNGGISVGSWMQLSDPSVAEIMGAANFDWVAVDLEHGNISHHELPNIFRALELGNTLPLVRVAEGNPSDCKQALDAGAGGVIVPMVESAEQLISVRDACCWPPAGMRGVAFSRANLFGKNFDIYKKESQKPLLIAMIENVCALNNLDDILNVEGLDAILIGPYDLSASLGLIGEFEHTDFLSARNKILNCAKEKNIAAGMHVVEPSSFELKARIDEGYQFLAYSIDTVILRKAVEKDFSFILN